MFFSTIIYLVIMTSSCGQSAGGMLNDGQMQRMQQMANHIKAAAKAANNQINHERIQNKFKVNELSKRSGSLKYRQDVHNPLGAQQSVSTGNLSSTATTTTTNNALTIDPFSPEWRQIYLEHCVKSYAREICEKLFDWSYFDHWLNAANSLTEKGVVGLTLDVGNTLKKAAKECKGVRKTKGTTGEDACLWKSMNAFFHRNNDGSRTHMWLVRLRPWYDLVCGADEDWSKCSKDFHRVVSSPFNDVFGRFRIPLQGLHMIFRSFIVDCFNEFEARGPPSVQTCVQTRIGSYVQKLSDPKLAALAFS